jgi:hypothetical protein
MDFVTARKIWENGSFMGNCETTFAFPCSHFSNSTPRLGWVVPFGGCCGVQQGYALAGGNPNPGNPAANVLAGVIEGVWIEYDGHGVLIDATDVANVVGVCNACCGGSAAATARYDGVFPTAADIADTQWQFTRTDNGSMYDFQRASLAYQGQYTEGSFVKVSHVGGVSTYRFMSNQEITGHTGDTFTESARVFNSNDMGTIAAGNHFIANAVINGVTMPTLDDDGYDTAALLLTAVQGNATWAAHGTWSLSGTILRLTSTTAVAANIVITDAAD